MDLPDPTPDAASDATASAPRSGRIDGWVDFGDRLRAILAMGSTEPADWRLCDADFARWPLGERGVVEAWQQWALAHPRGRMVLLATRLDELPRRHPRWLAWRRDWTHRVTCWQASEEDAPQVRPMLLWAGRIGLRLLDEVTGAGVWSTDPATLQTWQADFDVISQRSTEGMPSTTLGL